MKAAHQEILVDFGSTFTKLVVVDLQLEAVVARSQAVSTVGVDASLGLKNAFQNAFGESVDSIAANEYIASSSAAGGLRMICSGFVPELSSEAAARVALGAGAKVVGTFSHRLTSSELQTICDLTPDIILLCGGTDGGNSEVLLHNAKVIAYKQHLEGRVLVAGNKDTHDEIVKIFSLAGKPVLFCENVLPEIGKVNPDPCNNQIRELFIKHIVKAKGIRQDVLMPTPLAVLNAGKLLAEGVAGEDGLGDLIIIDVGGSTTDVVSISNQSAANPHAIIRGLPEPYAKRTVEGDLGVRFGLEKIVDIATKHKEGVDHELIRYTNLVSQTARLPATEMEKAFDSQLAKFAVKEAFERHVGRVEIFYTPSGEVASQYGKNLSGVGNVIGTGGPIAFSPDPRRVLEGVLYHQDTQHLLKPRRPRFFVDKNYVLYAMGLLATSFPEKALRIMKKCLRQV